MKRLLILILIALPLICGCATIGVMLGAMAEGYAASAPVQQQSTSVSKRPQSTIGPKCPLCGGHIYRTGNLQVAKSGGVIYEWRCVIDGTMWRRR